MNRAALHSLYRQKASLTNSKSNMQGHLTALNSKISRLRSAATELSAHIATLQNHHQKVGRLTVDESQWKGTKKQKFDDRYGAYRESVKHFLTTSKDKKAQLDEEIMQAENSKGLYESRVSTISSQISKINSQIEQARKE